MDIIFWSSFTLLFLLHLFVAKLIFRVYSPSKPLKQCRDPSIQYWRFYMVQLANFRTLLSILLGMTEMTLGALTQVEQSFISNYRLLQLVLQNVVCSYVLNLILDSIFHHNKDLSRFQQKIAVLFALLVLFSQTPLVWQYVIPIGALNELPNMLLTIVMCQYPQPSLLFSFLFLLAFIGARYFLFIEVYPPLLANTVIGIQFKACAILFEECQLIWSVYFLECFFKQLTERYKRLQESEKPRIYKQVRNAFQFLLRSKKGKFILVLGIFTVFFQKTLITVIFQNEGEMIHF